MGRKLKGNQSQAKGLKGALQNHIHREKVRQEEQRLAQISIQGQKDKAESIKNGPNKKKNAANQIRKRVFIPFNTSETVLLVGEGDFSFASSLIRQNLVLAEDLVATGLDTEAEVISKYPEAKENIEYLKDSGASVLHGINATNLVQSMKLKTSAKTQNVGIFESGKRLNFIVFNFPHNGRGIKDVDRNIREHQKLLLSFFNSSISLFKLANKRSGAASSSYFPIEESMSEKIIVSLFEGEPYDSWRVRALAKSVGFCVEQSGSFDWSKYEGYHHRRTNSMKDTTKPASEREARMYMFKKAVKEEDPAKKTKK